MPGLFIVTGELSGDLHAAGVVKPLKRVMPGVEISAVGGPHLKALKIPLIASIDDLSVMGLVEALRKYPVISRIMSRVVNHIRRTRPDVLLLVDFPGFNLPLLKKVRRYCRKVVYYVSPQIWAWKYSRIRIIRSLVDEMVVLFPFEERLYRKESVSVHYFGHPLAERVRAAVRTARRGAKQAKTLLFMPGSRRNEVRALIPVMNSVAVRLQAVHPDLSFIFSRAPGIPEELMRPALAGLKSAETAAGGGYGLIARADAVVAASGTAALEVSLCARPMCVVYLLHWLSFQILRRLVRVRFVSLPNLLLDRELVKEFVSWKLDAVRLVPEVESLLYDERRRALMRSGMARVSSLLYRKGSYERTAGLVSRLLKSGAEKK